MKRLSFILTALVTLAACSQVQPPVADKAPGLEPQTLGTTADDRGKELAFVPRLGAIYVAGITKGSLDARNRGGFDIYLRRYKQNKTVVWSRQIASHADDIVGDIAADSKGRLYVGGRQGDKCFHSKYAEDGTLLWKRTYSFCSKEAMAVDTLGNIYLTDGSFDGTSGAVVYEVRKYNENGRQVYSANFSFGYGLAFESIKDVAVDNSGNAYVYAVEYDDDPFDFIVPAR